MAVECEGCLPNVLVRELAKEHGTPLFIIDCEQVVRQYRRLAAALPAVALHYAVKALPHPEVLATLRDEGSCFDVASAGEIALLREQQVEAGRTVHTHPIKSLREIHDALAFGCNTFVVDNSDELHKFSMFRDRAQLLLRVSFRSSDAVVDLSKKFGCSPLDVLPLLRQARDMGLSVRGLSFHVGSQCKSPRAHVVAIEACRELIEAAESAGLPTISMLDIGGGFPVSYDSEALAIEPFCEPIRTALATLPSRIRVISEPGRYIAAPAAHAVAEVVGKAQRGDHFWYYLDDGVYGSYSGQIYDSARYPLTVLSERPGSQRLSFLAGPTCDSVDMIAEGIFLPELEIGDLVLGHCMGAYTSASASDFNSLRRASVVVLAGAETRAFESATTHTRLVACRDAHETLAESSLKIG